MRYIVTGVDLETGQPIELTVEAADVPTAAAVGAKKGVTVAGVRAVRPSTPPQIPRTRTPPPTTPKKKAVRLWLSLVLLIAGVLAPLVPAVPLWAGVVVLVLVALYILPFLRRPVGGLLRVSPTRPAWRAFKLATFILIGVGLIGFSSVGREMIRDRHAAEAERAADEVAKAQAESAANDQVSNLVEKAKASLTAGDIAEAQAAIDEALNVGLARNHGAASGLNTAIINATDSAWALDTLAHLSATAFEAFRNGGKVPPSLDLGYAVLTDKAVTNARSQIDAAVAKRAEIKKQEEKAAAVRRERAAAAAEAARAKAKSEAVERRRIADAKAAAEAAERAKFEKTEGVTIHIGYTSYCAWDSHWSNRLSTNQFLDKRANANWLFVNMTVRNDDKKARIVPPIKLIDEEGREYQSSAEGMMIENSIGVLETLNPDVSKQGYVVFDVPKGRTYKLKLSGGYYSSDVGYIRLVPTEK